MGDRSILAQRALATASGLLLGAPCTVHPVIVFGRLMGAVEARLYAARRAPGASYAATASFGLPHGARNAVPDSNGLETLPNALGGYSP